MQERLAFKKKDMFKECTRGLKEVDEYTRDVYSKMIDVVLSTCPKIEWFFKIRFSEYEDAGFCLEYIHNNSAGEEVYSITIISPDNLNHLSIYVPDNPEESYGYLPDYNESFEVVCMSFWIAFGKLVDKYGL